MKLLKLTAYLVLVSVLLSGCSGKMIQMLEPSGGNYSRESLPNNKARLIVYRTDELSSVNLNPGIEINGQFFSFLPNASYFQVDADPGQYQVNIKAYPGYAWSSQTIGKTVNLTAGQTAYLELDNDPLTGGVFTPFLVMTQSTISIQQKSAADAEIELIKLRRVLPTDRL